MNSLLTDITTCLFSSHIEPVLPIHISGLNIRPMPDTRIPGGFVLCRERQACRYGARCTFAHSKEECRAWNAQTFGRNIGKQWHKSSMQGIIINTCSMPSV